VARSRSGSALQPHWRWRSVASLVVFSVVGTLFALGWVQAVGGIGLDKALAGGLLVAGYLAGGQFLYDFIWWRWQRWRLLVVASVAAFGVYLLVAGLLNSSYTSPLSGRSWSGLAVLLGLAGGALLTVIWWLRKDRLRAEGWRW
jgi:hypothetical protein